MKNLFSSINDFIRKDVRPGEGLSSYEMIENDSLITSIDKTMRKSRIGPVFISLIRNVKLHMGFNLGMRVATRRVNNTPMSPEQYEQFKKEMDELDRHREEMYRLA